MSLKLITANIEGHRHFDERLLPFLKQEQPDFISLQEVFAVDIPILKAELGMEGHFYPMANITETTIHMSHALGSWGIAQLSKYPILSGGFEYYTGNHNQVPDFVGSSDPNAVNRVLSWLTVEKDHLEYTFATTHFIWTPNGDPIPLQTEKLEVLQGILAKLPPYIVMGDFNAPRGRATFDELAVHLKDTIPPEVTTSIDGSLHKAGDLQLMVDGLFSTPEYQVSKVRLVDGISDHKPVVAEVVRL